MQRLVEQVQREYVAIYGGPDGSPMSVEEFASPTGRFWLGSMSGVPVVMGGWRVLQPTPEVLAALGPAAEIKRMYVDPDFRGRGLARTLLARMESAAVEVVDWLVLETGQPQPAAVELYRSCGYQPVPAFGHYAAQARSLHLGKPVGHAWLRQRRAQSGDRSRANTPSSPEAT